MTIVGSFQEKLRLKIVLWKIRKSRSTNNRRHHQNKTKRFLQTKTRQKRILIQHIASQRQ